MQERPSTWAVMIEVISFPRQKQHTAQSAGIIQTLFGYKSLEQDEGGACLAEIFNPFSLSIDSRFAGFKCWISCCL